MEQVKCKQMNLLTEKQKAKAHSKNHLFFIPGQRIYNKTGFLRSQRLSDGANERRWEEEEAGNLDGHVTDSAVTTRDKWAQPRKLLLLL